MTTAAAAPARGTSRGYIESKNTPNLTEAAGGYVEPKNWVNLTGYGGARPLSKLQTWILEHARVNRLAEHRDGESRGADLYYKEVLAGFYGFPYDRYRNPECDPLRKSLGSQRFHPDQIGRPKYNAACAAISRACSRLEQRGLVRVMTGACSHWAGVSLAQLGGEA